VKDTPSRKQLGAAGEKAAADFLKRRGYVILRRRFQTRYGEVDIVARDGPVLCFIEVKTRTDLSFGPPAKAVTAAKKKRLALSAQAFLTKKKLGDAPVRFDVVAVLAGAGGFEIDLFQGAFENPFDF